MDCTYDQNSQGLFWDLISSLAGKHCESKTAVIGSGPTASLYRGDCDISIAVNGAALLPYRFNYFMCGDVTSPERNWFYVDCADIRVIADLVATCDKKLYPVSKYPKIKRITTHQHLRCNLGTVPNPEPPHIVFSYCPFKAEKLSRQNDFLMYGGTVSCCALQLAWIMGAKKIDIYGCPFSHSAGSYFYHCGDPGAVTKSQKDVMQSVIDIIRADTEVNIVGNSLLI